MAADLTYERGIARVVWPGDPPITMTFERFQADRRSGDTSAELSVHASLNGAGALHRSRLNLLSSSTRNQTAKTLAERDPGRDWSLMLEEACWKVLDAHRQGQPAILLRDAPIPDGDDSVLPPFALRGDPVITFGDSGSVKSYLHLAAAASIHSGRSLLAGLKPTTTMKVGIFDFEWKPEKHLKRLRALWGPGELPAIVYVPCMAAGPLSHQVERLRSFITEHGIEYGIFDSVALACAGPPEDAAVALDFFQALAYLELAGSWLIAHVNRGGDTDRPFGSTFWQASARSTWYVKKVREGGDLVDLHLFHRKVNDGPKLPPVGIQFQFAGRVSVIKIPVIEEERSTGSGTESTVTRMKAALANGSEPMTYYELAAELDVAASTIRDKASIYAGRVFDIVEPLPGSRQKRVRLRGNP